jgi:hypothetical protein
LGELAIGGIIFFGTYLFQQSVLKFWREHPFWMDLMHFWEKTSIRPNIPRYLSDSFADFLQRRNEFWTTYGQILIAALIIVILSILLLTKAISAEAGLPILSGISGFAIAKGVSGGRTGGGPEGPQG